MDAPNPRRHSGDLRDTYDDEPRADDFLEQLPFINLAPFLDDEMDYPKEEPERFEPQEEEF